MEKVHKINEYISVTPSSETYVILLPIVNIVKSCFYVFVGTKKKYGVKSEKHCSYEHFTGTV